MPDDNGVASTQTNIPTPTLPPVAVADGVNAPVPSGDAAMPSVDGGSGADGGGASADAGGASVPDSVVVPPVPVNPAAAAAPDIDTAAPVDKETPAEVARKIGEAHNVLVALSSDPSVDEMAAAIGLSLFLDRLGKRATAIYSGATPNALEFLKPEETFEPSVDTLQDFVIALNKDKADHLRYKLDGDYVKIFITPYKSKIAEEDLEFSYGDYNVDLVLALDVANGVDLDSALREHGRIMHDAVIVNITTGNPGKLGEIEWSDKNASSVSEMIAKLLYSVNSKVKIEKEEATAFLTGIVAATNRFSNAGTTPETMKIASKLMESGANQQLVSKNITPDIENEMFGLSGVGTVKIDDDPTKLDIQHGNEEGVDESKVVSDTVTEKESTLLDDLKAAEASLAGAGAEATPETEKEPVKMDSEGEVSSQEAEAGEAEEAKSDAKTEEAEETPKGNIETDTDGGAKANPGEGGGGFISDKPEKVIQPPSDMAGAGGVGEGDTNKYGQMLEDALASVGDVVPPEVPSVEPSDTTGAVPPEMSDPVSPEARGDNPAATGAPAVPVNPEFNGVPEINYMPMPGDEVLPPPPTPPIDMSESVEPARGTEVAAVSEPVLPAVPAAPAEGATEGLGVQPAMQDQVYAPQVADPSAFKIPGT